MNEARIQELQERLDATTDALRKAEERATAGRLALEMLHEVRGPLEALGHLTYLANHEAEHPERVREYLQMAEEQMTNLRTIATETLGISRVSSSPKPMDLVALSEAALRIHQRAVRDKRIQVIKRLPGQLMTSGYRGEMLQAISNLILNAVEELPEEGTLFLKARRCDGHVHLLVADSGRGIASEHLTTIFEPFFTTKGENGNGLGLSLTKKIVDHHSGKIRVRSSVEPHRSGTTFRISLPIAS